ncbi:triose-phosphate isomerase [Leucothrix mucor]|uniref:triose-phosphate isomerase n=1 Tax=Leucothrix mucor TaxID=45248 RepID=UPI0003B3165A|nr:triose-phosphate isomerase [Leucothrix mucor]
MRKTLIAGNWKLNGSGESITELLKGIVAGLPETESLSVAVCPPYIYIPMVADILSDQRVMVGSQNVAAHAKGAYTGEISASMLSEFGCQYGLVGHSERRSLYNEADADVAVKFKVLSDSGIIPVLCVGETLEERDQGVTESVVSRQIQAVIDQHGIAAFAAAVIAYEPVWAIGTGRTATPEQAQDVHAAIRALLATYDKAIADTVQIVYGGSMNPGNAAELLAMSDIDGGLIGGASLNADDFLAICRAA